MRATWYVMEDGSVADPSEVTADAAGVLRHRDGRAVAMRGDVPRSRGVDVDAQRRDMKPAASGQPYLTRSAAPGEAGKAGEQDDELVRLREDYHRAAGKRPFHGWDAATLREKIAAL